MSSSAILKNENYTWEDYLSWDDDKRYEIIDGKAYALASPRQKHQEILGELYMQFKLCLKKKPCKVYLAPSDVRLDKKTVVQPDVFIVCDKSKLDGQFTNGAPDLIIEIVSPSTIQKDRLLKYNKYLNAGVNEYWIIEPEGNLIEVFILENGNYTRYAYTSKDKIKPAFFDSCVIDMKKIFTS